MKNPQVRAKRPALTPSQALTIFAAAPDAALLHQEVVSAVFGVSVATLEKARSIGDEAFPSFLKVGSRVRYRAGTVRAHLARFDERVVA